MKNRRYAIPRPYSKIGERLMEKRITAGLTQKYISDKLGYNSSQFVSNFERGICLPPLNKLHTILRLCGSDAEEIAEIVAMVEREVFVEPLARASKRMRS